MDRAKRNPIFSGNAVKAISSGRLVIWMSALIVVAFVFWASWAEIDQITRATGQVIASSRNQVIQSQDGGVLEELMVKEGATVKRGQLLLRFEQAKAKAAYLEVNAKAAALQGAVARLNAEIFGGQPKFPTELSEYPELRRNQQVLFNKRQSALHDEIATLQEYLLSVRSELEMNMPLLKAGDVSRAEILKLQRQVTEVQGQIIGRNDKYMQEAQADLAKAQEDLAGVSQALAQRKEQLDATEIHAPMDGIVRNVRLTTRGGVAKPGEEIMQIVPLDDEMIFEAKVKPSDIAFVKANSPTTVKIDAFDYSIYGTIKGEVSFISADTINEDLRGNEQPYYRVLVKTKGKSLKGDRNSHIEIQHGMTGTAEIKTGSYSVLHYLFKPITKTMGESLGER